MAPDRMHRGGLRVGTFKGDKMQQFQQGSKEWLLWRHRGLGASDAATILGISPYNTPLELWREKLQAEPSEGWEMRHASDLGHKAEERARAAYEFEQEATFAPLCIEHEKFPFLRASLDGWSDTKLKGCEIKYVGAEKFEACNTAADVPPHHMTQMQDQMMLAGSEEWDYVLCTEAGGDFKHKVVTVKADQDYQTDLMAKMVEFWGMVQNKTQPPYHQRDWVPVENEELAALLDCLRDIKDSKKKADTEQAQAWRVQIAALCQHQRTVCAGTKITWAPATNKLTITFAKKEAASVV